MIRNKEEMVGWKLTDPQYIPVQEEGIFTHLPSELKAVIFKGYAELADNGFAGTGVTGPQYDDLVLVKYSADLREEAFLGPSMAYGVMIYRKTEWNNTFWIVFSYIQPKYRGMGNGFYDSLYNKLKELGKEAKVFGIGSMINPYNERAIKAVEKRHRTPVGIEYMDKL